jgi:hypothetical protein
MESRDQSPSDHAELEARSFAYLDGIFGAGAGARHGAFLDRLDAPALREMLHRAHLVEADTRLISLEENYLLGMVVLAALRAYAPAGMFAKTLLHLGTSREKLSEAIARLGLWVGPIAAAEAAAHLQKAMSEYQRDGLASLAAWFPVPRATSAPSSEGPR